ncbi:hypothetical protein F0562_020685 [Nyssa sinensis]|uniref:Uncharacterized protein n=1 Tax=Nyssa sinensis TaxID=561372 RepID=A0A5J5BT76_9ASTE|nr:hypothetical protein F0562_020685 [Nyssa sinensis]
MGHGTQTSSTAAGSRVPYADYFGYAKGIANVIAPKAQLAMYKVLFFRNSYDAAAGSARYEAPDANKIHNGVPWITTVGAGTVDCDFAAQVILGDGVLTVIGKSVYPENLLVSKVPIYYGHGHGNRSKEICDCNTLDPEEVAGKYIFCDFNDGLSVFQQLLECTEPELLELSSVQMMGSFSGPRL